jgi:4-phosphopantoate--beta-alanine ligase
MGKVSLMHPRAESLRIRERLAEGFKRGLVVPEGLAAHGRGEAFDYLLGERTTPQARRAIRAGVAALLLARSPVISVNGNVAALVPRETVRLAEAVGAKLEVNLFHGSRARERRIARWLRKHGARAVLGTEPKFWTRIPEVYSDRRKVDRRGIASADVVLVPLEDGDRTEGLKRLGKRVVAIDLNPMSRTARAADITVVDNLVRAMPLMLGVAKRLPRAQGCLRRAVEDFDNRANLKATFELMRKRLGRLGGFSSSDDRWE